MAAVPRALAPLRHRGYRWLAAALVASLLSTGAWVVAVVWQVVELGGGPAELSLVTAANAVGLLTTTLLGGALADRVPQRRILLGVALTEAGTIGLVAVLSLLGVLQLWQLAAVGLAGGIALGLYFPAWSALVPALLPAEDLLPANGLEGVLRPVLMQAAGPAVAGALVAASGPGVALAASAACAGVAALCVAAVPATPLRRELTAGHSARALLTDVGEGFRYMVRTPWLLATLLFASVMILVMMGPLQVLVPFAVRDQAGGGPAQHAMVLAAFGIGGAVGSLVVASLRLPRRYLTVMNLLWGVGVVPLVVFGVTSSLAVMIAASALIGAAFQSATVIWGTLLQRRVPPELLGRVSSLDFFVSLAFMPVSMALAGPVSEVLGLRTTFLLAGLVPPVLAVAAIVAARLTTDEIEHPLDTPAGPVPTDGPTADDPAPASAR